MINDILDDREKRYYKILSLIDRYKQPVICGKINYPGANKNTQEATKAFNALEKLLIKEFLEKSLYSKTHHGKDGSSLLIVINCGAVKAKEICIDIENKHPLGRVFDIDIYNTKGTPISRTELGHKPRKCVVCDGYGKICTRTQKHTYEEVINRKNELINCCTET